MKKEKDSARWNADLNRGQFFYQQIALHLYHTIRRLAKDSAMSLARMISTKKNGWNSDLNRQIFLHERRLARDLRMS